MCSGIDLDLPNHAVPIQFITLNKELQYSVGSIHEITQVFRRNLSTCNLSLGPEDGPGMKPGLILLKPEDVQLTSV